MQASEARRAVAAAMASATSQGLTTTAANVLNDSNRLVLRLMPCDVVARVAPLTHPHGSAELELEVVRLLGETDSPVTELEPRVIPHADIRDGFVVTMWTHYEHAPDEELAPADYARALERLHAGMRQIDVTTPHFLDRVAGNQRDVADRNATPDLPDADRTFLADTLERLRKSILDRSAPEQLLHGEPHPWNILSTKDGLLFMDFENACRGPVEYDLGWVPLEVSALYPNVDQELVDQCRGLMIAIVAACHWRADDEHPGNTRRAEWIKALRAGPPWPSVEDV